jgi:asparagine synthase (glutamine-hydrolysing)
MSPTGLGSAYRAVRGLFGYRDLERLGVLTWIGEHDLRRLFDPQLPVHGADDDADRVAYLELTRYMRNQLLRDTDSMAMSLSLEVRVPLLDDRVVEVATAIPSAVRNRPGKATLQEAAGIGLDGPKRGFTLPFGTWLRGPLREPIRQGVLDDDLPLAWLMGAEGRRDLWLAFEEGRTHWSRPWAVAMVRMWAQVHELRW